MKNTQGFTLVEVLVVISILTIISLFLSQIYLDYVGLYQRENTAIDLNLANQTVINNLSSDIRGAAAVLPSYTVSGQDFTSGNQTLILSVPAFNAQKQIISGIYDTVVYYLDTSTPRKLIKRVVSAPTSSRTSQTKTIDSDVSFLDFTYNTTSTSDAKSIMTTLATSRALAGRAQAVTSTLRAILRNR